MTANINRYAQLGKYYGCDIMEEDYVSCVCIYLGAWFVEAYIDRVLLITGALWP